MRLLVAGGSGFIGSHLCECLLSQPNNEVVCIDNLVTGRLENIEPLFASPQFQYIQHDIVQPLPPLRHIDRVYHLASPASPVGYQRHPIETLRVNSEGTRRLLELCATDMARFLYASTSEVYGDPLEHPQREDYRGNVSSTGPRSMYDEAKRFGEALTTAFAHEHMVDARIVRIFNTYGPRSDPHDGRIIPNFISHALMNEPLDVYGDGLQTRSLCFVRDLVEGLIRAMECPGTRGQVINLGNPEEHTVLEFAHRVRRLTGTVAGLHHRPPAVGDDPQRRRPDITRARALLDWAPTTTLDDGLTTTIADIRAALLAQDTKSTSRVRASARHGR